MKGTCIECGDLKLLDPASGNHLCTQCTINQRGMFERGGARFYHVLASLGYENNIVDRESDRNYENGRQTLSVTLDCALPKYGHVHDTIYGCYRVLKYESLTRNHAERWYSVIEVSEH